MPEPKTLMAKELKKVSPNRKSPTELSTISKQNRVALKDVTDTNEVTQQRRTFVAYMVRGVRQAEACRRMGITTQTARRWRKEQWYPVVIQEETDKLLGNPNQVFSPMLPPAIGTYLTKLDENNFDVAKDVMDRLFGKPVTRTQSDVKQSVTVIFTRLGDEPALPPGQIIDVRARIIEDEEEEG